MPQIDFQVLFELILNLFQVGSDKATELYGFWPQILFWYKIGAYVFIMAGAGLAFYFAYQIMAIRIKEREDLYGGAVNVVPEASMPTNPHWMAIVAKMQSENSNDWKQAIIEADKILDEMVKRMGYPGENLGERLRAVEPSDFVTLNDAWEAHKVRNQIAHEPGFELSYRTAAQTIGQYERVFKEFSYI